MHVLFLTPTIGFAMAHMALMALMDLTSVGFLFGATLLWWPTIGIDPVMRWRTGCDAKTLSLLIGVPVEKRLGIALTDREDAGSSSRRSARRGARRATGGVRVHARQWLARRRRQSCQQVGGIDPPTRRSFVARPGTSARLRRSCSSGSGSPWPFRLVASLCVSAVLGTTATDGTMVAVHNLGGHGRLALLVHAAGFLAQVLAPLASELDGAIASWAPDLRGHGCSGAPPGGDFAWGGFALDVIASARLVTDEIAADETPRCERLADGGRVQLLGIGHSVGATALLLAEASWPGTFSALYCYEPILVPAGERRPVGTPNPLAEAARRRTATFSSRTAAADRYRSSRSLSHLDPKVLAAYISHGFADRPDGTVTLRCLPDHEALVYENGMASDAFDRLGEVRCPVTVAVGTRSLDRGRGSAPVVVAALPDARLVEVEGLGHLGPLESPADVAASVLGAFGTPTA